MAHRGGQPRVAGGADQAGLVRGAGGDHAGDALLEVDGHSYRYYVRRSAGAHRRERREPPFGPELAEALVECHVRTLDETEIQLLVDLFNNQL
ncbi:hypothetical protein GCM10027360_47080 [Amycolatopsis echigonensis]